MQHHGMTLWPYSSLVLGKSTFILLPATCSTFNTFLFFLTALKYIREVMIKNIQDLN